MSAGVSAAPATLVCLLPQLLLEQVQFALQGGKRSILSRDHIV